MRMKSARVVFIFFMLVANLWDAESKKLTFDEIKIALQPVRNICVEKVKVDPKLVDDSNKGNFATDRSLKCYFKCMLIMTKVMTKDDNVIKEAFVKNMQFMLQDELKKSVIKAFKHCDDVASQKIEGCELAYQMAKCYYEYDPSLNFYP